MHMAWPGAAPALAGGCDATLGRLQTKWRRPLLVLCVCVDPPAPAGIFAVAVRMHMHALA